ncbi:TspO/MBR family protein [Desulfonatronovibrio hydrogenovorans]|uniref:TspO/MBR family protein n=1 Tax=Desulfonatronovibrio hydrogenovorans TaxID=53245 RepID=UPI001FC968FB|nr:TspO/MBR family protein [Desulfonatronovibrio hydrogenovorans]
MKSTPQKPGRQSSAGFFFKLIREKHILSLAGFMVLVAAASMFGAFFRPGPWYDELVKPALTPPGWIFTPVWMVLYLFMAVAGWLVWIQRPVLRQPAILLWAGQLVLNGLWSWLFFGLQSPGAAFVNILMLFLLILVFIRKARPLSRAASILFIPYALWVAFAAYLNLGLVLLN